MSTSAISDLTIIDSFAAQIKAVIYPVSCLQIHSLHAHNKNCKCIYSKESTQYTSCYSSTRLPNWNKDILGSRTNLAKVQTSKQSYDTLWYLSFCLILYKKQFVHNRPSSTYIFISLPCRNISGKKLSH